MAHTDPKAGGWASKEKLTSAQMNLVRTAINNSPDASAGGTYTLSGKLTFNGTDMFELGGQLLYGSRSITRLIPMNPVVVDNEWSFADLHWQTTGTTASNEIIIPIFGIPHGSNLTTITARFRGGTGHAGVNPAAMPVLEVYKRDLDDLLETSLGSTTDSTVAASYESAHNISVTGINEDIDKTTTQYYVRFVSESGANAQSGAHLLGLSVVCTITSQSEWDG